MAELTEKRQVYFIPDNYISESRVHLGQMTIRVRYLIDSLILTAFLGTIAVFFIMLVMPDMGASVKLTAALILCAPGFILGQVGYNGDPISTAMKSLIEWRKNSEICLYNMKPRLLGTDPVKALQNDASGRDTMVEVYSNFMDSLRRDEEEMVEGENFEFRFDPGIDNYLHESGDYEDENDQENLDVQINSEVDINDIRFVFSSDGYNEPEDESINFSDFETN